VRSVGLKALKNKLSEYVRLASRGEVILVTDRDKVVAELVPPRDTRADLVSDATLAQLVRTGVLAPPLYPPSPPPRATRTSTLAELLAELDADRGR
jgi:prevent-host-death family protein